ncbi:MAG: spermidine/putrescine ABC transporter substrate-binding protein, partial [bacterium]|nr:spermidine/putrescine ABC transporter substrate-binding protein [bacterium]
MLRPKVFMYFSLLLLFSCTSPPETDQRASDVISAHNLNVSRSRLSKSLHIFTYPDYIAPGLVEQFQKVYGVNLIFDYYDTNESMIAKLQAGGLGQYDLVVPSDYAVTILTGQSLLDSLDKQNIPNLENLAPRFQNMPFDPGNRYTACYQWGTSGIGIRTDLIKTSDAELDTWKILFDPKFQPGPFTMLDDPRETVGAALKYLGYSVNTTREKELQAAEDLLLQQRKRVLTYASSSTAQDLLVSADAAAVHNFSGTVFMAQAEVNTIRYVIPREGAILWTDNLAVPIRAPHQYTAEIFINF